MNTLHILRTRLKPEQLFMMSALVVNGGNYLYNLILGRWLGPEGFAQAALMVTMLLMVAFAGMTFQLTAAKFRGEWDGHKWRQFRKWFYTCTLGTGTVLGIGFVLGSTQLAHWFNSDNSLPYIVFGAGIPLYFALSFRRGRLQGALAFYPLAGSYQAEMWGRLLLTLVLLLALPAGLAVATGIAGSFLIGLIPGRQRHSTPSTHGGLSQENRKVVLAFVAMTALYECTQILINNGDILLVTHFFDATTAGQYAALALVGRVVYFVTWMFIMVLLPEVIQKRKSGESTRPLLLKYFALISLLSGSIVLLCFTVPKLLIQILFGAAYLEMAPLLGWYALATALFALANVFTYYYLALDRFGPMFLTAFFGLFQMGLMYFWHPSLEAVLGVQIICMALLLGIQLLSFIRRSRHGKYKTHSESGSTTATLH